MSEFHVRLSSLQIDIFIVQKILNFPLYLFSGFEGGLFLSRVVHNFGSMAVLKITSMVTDQGSDARTLTKFKNFVSRAVKPEFRDDYRQLLRELKFGTRTESLLKKARDLRNSQIAHSIRDPKEPLSPDEVLTFGEIKILADELIRLFEAVSFSSEYRYLPVSYDSEVCHPLGGDHRPDIERILDSIARESTVIRQPEEFPELWYYRRANWSQSKLGDFNAYRRKFGLPDV